MIVEPNKWDKRFLDLAQHVAGWSKDPSTKCGAVIARGNRFVSMGFNGFPQHTKDAEHLYSDRAVKYLRVVHAEVNALLFSQCDLSGCTMYVWPMPPCARCAAQICQTGIARVVAMYPGNDDMRSRWESEMSVAMDLFYERGIVLELVRHMPAGDVVDAEWSMDGVQVYNA